MKLLEKFRYFSSPVVLYRLRQAVIMQFHLLGLPLRTFSMFHMGASALELAIR